MNESNNAVATDRVLVASGVPVSYKNAKGEQKQMFSMAVNLDALLKLKGSGKEIIAQVCADGKLRINAIPAKTRTVAFSRQM